MMEDLYTELASKLKISREEAKVKVLKAAYGLVSKTHIQQVEEFHKKFSLPWRNLDEAVSEHTAPRELTNDEALFRIGFMIEELAEYCEASGYDRIADNLKYLCRLIKDRWSGAVERSPERDMHGQLDALVDLSYVLSGTALFHGFDLDGAFRVVHEANMRKVRATSEDQSKRGSKLDVIKPEGWSAPDLSRFLT